MSRFSVCRLSVQALISLILSAASPVSAQPQGTAAWVELTGHGAEVRAVAAGDGCPRALVDGQARPMTPRVAAAPDFPLVCSLPLPKAVRSLSVDGRPLAVPVPEVRRVVILGDTGCRVKDLTIQACNDPKAWPFAAVARLAARKRPDLVIHVGDYYYRETACPTFVSGCADSPYGDHGATWAAEFFDPARPLLEAAPWVFARGNHEVCARGGRGWYRFLDAGPAPEGCPALSAPFTVRAGDLNLFVLDSGSADDRGVTAEGVAAIAGQLDRLGDALNRGQGWIVTHRPVWGLVPIARIGPVGPLQVGLNFTEQAAFKGRSLAGVQMVVSGHVHHFSAISFGAARPAQLIVGTGGDVGEAADTPRIYGGEARLDDMDAATFTFSRYGYYLMDRDGEDWVGAFHDAQDIVRAQCRLRQRVLSCTAPKTAPPAG